VGGSVGIVFAPDGCLRPGPRRRDRQTEGHLRVVLMPTVSVDRKITRLDVIADPDRLRRMQFALLPD